MTLAPCSQWNSWPARISSYSTLASSVGLAGLLTLPTGQYGSTWLVGGGTLEVRLLTGDLFERTCR